MCYVLCLTETPALNECQCVSRVAAMMFRHSRFCFYPFCPQRTFVFIMQSYYVSKETQVLHQNPHIATRGMICAMNKGTMSHHWGT